MTCEIVRLPGGGGAIVCGIRRRRCSKCGRPRAMLQCDFPTSQGKTCDAWLCRGCAVRGGPNIDYCPHHPDPASARATPWPRQPDLFQEENPHGKG